MNKKSAKIEKKIIFLSLKYDIIFLNILPYTFIIINCN